MGNNSLSGNQRILLFVSLDQVGFFRSTKFWGGLGYTLWWLGLTFGYSFRNHMTCREIENFVYTILALFFEKAG